MTSQEIQAELAQVHDQIRKVMRDLGRDPATVIEASAKLTQLSQRQEQLVNDYTTQADAEHAEVRRELDQLRAQVGR